MVDAIFTLLRDDAAFEAIFTLLRDYAGVGVVFALARGFAAAGVAFKVLRYYAPAREAEPESMLFVFCGMIVAYYALDLVKFD